MPQTNLIHTLSKNLKTKIFSISLEDYYFNTFTEYFAEIYEFALQLAITEQLLGLQENEVLQRNKATDLLKRYRSKYPTMTYDVKNTLFYIQQVKDRLVQEFEQHTTDENKKRLLGCTNVPDIYKGITVKASAFKLHVYAKTALLCYFKVSYLTR